MSFPLGDISLASRFTSGSQRARVITEDWIAKNGYCLACESDRLVQTPPNTPARDFVCSTCQNSYELKSSAANFGKRVVDGAYGSMIARIRAGTVSNLFLLKYGPAWEIDHLTIIHRVLLTETVIAPRKALSPNARRAGWVGCNILLERIPPEGQIPIIRNRKHLPVENARSLYRATDRLSGLSPRNRGWIGEVLSGLHRLNKEQFTISEAYTLEVELAALYPNNRNVRAKIRQQLQILRDTGFISFEGGGRYTLTRNATERQ